MSSPPPPSRFPQGRARFPQAASGGRFPAEWSRHRATWLAWPHHEPDWPGKFDAIPWVYAEIVRALHAHELVEILCHTEDVREDADRKSTRLNSSHVRISYAVFCLKKKNKVLTQ